MSAPLVQCSSCRVVLTSRYYAVNGTMMCGRCGSAAKVDAQRWGSRRVFLRAAAFGFGGAVLGALLYYAVMALTHLQIGIVAFLVGLMVGWAVRKGAQGIGGRRFQVLALVLTYYSVGMAYLPFVLTAGQTHATVAASASAAVSADSTSPARPHWTPPGVGDISKLTRHERKALATEALMRIPFAIMMMCLAALMLALSVFLLPIGYILVSLPGGFITAAIVALGMRQAWRMTVGRRPEVSGPFRMPTDSAPEAA